MSGAAQRVEDQKDLSVRFPRQSARGVLLGFSGPRAGVLIAAVLIVIFTLAAHGGITGVLFTGVVLWGPLMASAFVRVQGRPVVEWAPVWLHWRARQAAGQVEYRGRLIDTPRPSGTLALPGEGASLRFLVDEKTQICCVHDPWHQTLCAVLGVSHSAFALLSPDQQGQRVWGWGRALAALGNNPSIAAVQVLEAVVADPGTAIKGWWAEHGDHEEGFPANAYDDLLNRTSLASSTHRTLVSLSLDMKAAAKAIAQAGGGVTGAARVLAGDMAAFEQSLRAADLRVDHWLGANELAAVLRSAYDPAAVLTPASPGADIAHAGPIAISEHWDRLHTDSGWATVLWISEWPRIDVPPSFLHQLVFAPGVRRTFSIIARPLSTSAALRQIRKEKTSIIADQAQKAKVGQVQSLSDLQEYRDVESREQALIAGHADVEFVGLVAVSAPNEADLEAAVASIERAAGQAGCETRVLFGQQSQGFLAAALPLARRIW